LPQDDIPDGTTLWLFREKLAQAGLVETLFERFNQHLNASKLALAFFLAQARPRSCHPRRSFRRPIYEPGLIPPQ
jgi:IS5 family transposase